MIFNSRFTQEGEENPAEGTGLMAISYMLMKQMHGDIRVKAGWGQHLYHQTLRSQASSMEEAELPAAENGSQERRVSEYTAGRG